MAKVVWTEPALAQLEALIEFIALDKPEVAKAVARRVIVSADQFATLSRLGRPIPEFPHKSYRQLWVKPCWLYYRVEASEVVILHVRRGEKIFRVEDLFHDDP